MTRLREIEWAGDDDGYACCPVCRADRGSTHKADCWLAQALSHEGDARAAAVAFLNREFSPWQFMGDEPSAKALASLLLEFATAPATDYKAALKVAHALILDFEAITDPEAHPDLSARAQAMLTPCDEAGSCPVVPTAPTTEHDFWRGVQAARARVAAIPGGTALHAVDVLDKFLAAAPATGAPAEGWQPIATAPKVHPLHGGSDLLLYWNAPGINEPVMVVGQWRDGWWSGAERAFPTHWMPLPAPPSVEAGR